MATISNKVYRCTKCGHEMVQATNHYQATWSVGRHNTCPNCPPYKKYAEFGGQTIWECTEKEPEAMETLLKTSLNLRNAALENIKKYCKDNNCEEDFDNIKNELTREADEYNVKLPVDFYKDFYNLTIELIK